MILMATLNEKIARLIPLLSSDKDGEVVATARAIERTLKARGCDLHDLAARLVNGEMVAPSDRKKHSFEEIRRCPTLTDWEREFIDSIIVQSYRSSFRPSEKQEKILERLREKVRTTQQ
jgi:hypothetical protein